MARQGCGDCSSTTSSPSGHVLRAERCPVKLLCGAVELIGAHFQRRRPKVFKQRKLLLSLSAAVWLPGSSRFSDAIVSSIPKASTRSAASSLSRRTRHSQYATLCTRRYPRVSSAAAHVGRPLYDGLQKPVLCIVADKNVGMPIAVAKNICLRSLSMNGLSGIWSWVTSPSSTYLKARAVMRSGGPPRGSYRS